ncbi:hypothetical protein [Achromobacter sp. Bel]|uniref:hypothetical protein n=1 Tax=Achromobacter sp. Bel TaxID=2727415 RepID=UPI0020071683|nr:hypothetical protein [Achromobacter sp. Bel]
MPPAERAGHDGLPGLGRVLADEAVQIGLAAVGQFHPQRRYLAIADRGRDLAFLNAEYMR